MRWFHRLICLLRGHVSYERINVPATPKEPTGFPAGTIHLNPSTGSVYAVAGDGNAWVQVADTNSKLSLHAGPLQAHLHLCMRCHAVYWNTRIKLPALGYANAVPELADFRRWREREAWESKQRASNEIVGGAYRSYQVALKMVETPRSPPEQS